VYSFAQLGRQPGNPGCLKSEAAAYPLYLQVDVRTKSATETLATDGPAMAATFGDLLLEIDRLRSVSERIEPLVDKHPGMEDGPNPETNRYMN